MAGPNIFSAEKFRPKQLNIEYNYFKWNMSEVSSFLQ